MSAADQPRTRKRSRRRRNLIGLGVMLALIATAGVVLALNAGRWGVPMFGFTNEYGSKCRNDWLGHTCSEITVADVERHLGTDVPDGARLVSGSFRQTHDYELIARMVYPQAVARDGWDSLTEKFGDCRQDVSSPLDHEPDLSGRCVMTNIGVGAMGAEPSPRLWRIGTATQADGDTVIDIQLRSR